MVAGFGAYFEQEYNINSIIGIPVHVADNPTDCVIRGTGIALNNIEVLKKATKKRRK